MADEYERANRVQSTELKEAAGETAMNRPDESEVLELLREHRELFERLAESDLPISEDTKRGLARLEAEGRANEYLTKSVS